MSSKHSCAATSECLAGVALQRLMSDDCEWGSEEAALLEAALRACDNEVSPEVLEIIFAGCETKRLHAIKTLRRFCRAPEPFLLALHDTEKAVRCEAIAALSNLGRKSFLPFLVPALHDTSPEVRVAAAYALGRLRESGAHPYLLAALGDTHLPVQAMAAWAIRQIPPADPD